MLTRLIQISDCHLCATPGGLFRGIDPQDHLQCVVADARQRFAPVDHLLLTGDLTHHGGPDAYQRLLDSVEGLASERHWIPGNHDVTASMAGFDEAGLGLKRIDTDHWRLLLLDSTAAPDGRGGGSLSDTELAWLEHSLATAAPRWVFIALHHNPVALGSTWQDAIMLGNAARFWSILDNCSQVRAVIFGHVHQQHHLRRNAVELFAAPSTAVQFQARCDEFTLESDPELARPGYRYYELTDDGRVMPQLIRAEPRDWPLR